MNANAYLLALLPFIEDQHVDATNLDAAEGVADKLHTLLTNGAEPPEIATIERFVSRMEAIVNGFDLEDEYPALFALACGLGTSRTAVGVTILVDLD